MRPWTDQGQTFTRTAVVTLTWWFWCNSALADDANSDNSTSSTPPGQVNPLGASSTLNPVAATACPLGPCRWGSWCASKDNIYNNTGDLLEKVTSNDTDGQLSCRSCAGICHTLTNVSFHECLPWCTVSGTEAPSNGTEGLGREVEPFNLSSRLLAGSVGVVITGFLLVALIYIVCPLMEKKLGPPTAEDRQHILGEMSLSTYETLEVNTSRGQDTAGFIDTSGYISESEVTTIQPSYDSVC